MRGYRLLVPLALTVAALAPAVAQSTPESVVDVVRLAAGTTELAIPTRTLLTGVTWDSGQPAVAIRWHTAAGWTPYEALEPERPTDAGSAEDRKVRPGTEPVAPPRGADRMAVRVNGASTGLRVVTVTERTRLRWFTSIARASVTEPRIGTVITRSDWGADESIHGKTEYGPSVRAVVVHHTVDRNDYTEAEAPSLVRAIYAYHVRGRGFDDIGYHFVVDRFGRVFEGRRGVLDSKPVLGAHSAGFNTATIGVAMLGNHVDAVPSDATITSVGRVTAWAGARWHFDPRTTAQLTSRGSNKWRSGADVKVQRVSGHRDLVLTACPGDSGYGRLADIRQIGWAHLGPVFVEIVAPTAPVRPGTPGDLRAQLTAVATWNVTIATLAGLPVAQASGTGTAVSLKWDATIAGIVPAPPGTYTWTMTANDGIHGPSDPATGTITVTV